jgi:uncharacterized protein (TIGR04222 family)
MIAAALALAALVLSAHAVLADERILAFDSSIRVHQDASLTVTETIRVRAEGRNIRRGIYRDFPTRYLDWAGHHYRVDFQVLEVRRDDQTEAWHSESRANGVRVYLGDANRMLPAGIYEYTFRYRTQRQLGFFENHDELYWNVTGNGWDFPIDQVSARIELPAAVDWRKLRIDYRTGPQGSTARKAEHSIISGQTVGFSTLGMLGPREGLTVALGWPKGLVREPGIQRHVGWFLRDNGAALVLLIGFLAALAWYLWAWHHYGRDPARGIIIPRFEPPRGLSAAACRYVRDMALRSDAFTAAVVSLAVKGYLTIEDKDDGFVLYRQRGPQEPSATTGELAVLAELLPEDESWIELDNAHYQEFQRARVELREALKSEYHGRLFRLNTLYMIPALTITALTAVIAATQPSGPLPWIAFVILSLALHLLFLFLMRAPTPAGRRVMDEIAGFSMYLDTAEQDRLDRMRSPALTPEVFERFLPYAFALDVQNHWCERFAREFPREAAQGAMYSHGWYHGDRQGLSALHHVGTQFGAGLSSAISSASTPPGSASGSGGGGFSGGGGGGGGGGGW